MDGLEGDFGHDRIQGAHGSPVVTVKAGVSPIKLPRQDGIRPVDPVAAKVDELLPKLRQKQITGAWLLLSPH